jgi:hypothetical protein
MQVMRLQLIALQVGTLCASSSLSVRGLSSREGYVVDKTIMGLLGGASAVALLGASQASAAPPVNEVNLLQPARSFAELLEPIPDAEKVLRAENERSNEAAGSEEKPMAVADYYHHHYHHHHHHHHHHYYHHHYHHHHHHHYYY